MSPPSALQSFNESQNGAFIQSSAAARGFDSAAGDLIFAGRFSTFGGVTHRGIAVWRAATGTYDDDADWGLGFGATFHKAMVVGSTLYLSFDGEVWRCDKPGRTSIFSGGIVRDMCEWNGNLVIAANDGLWQWDGATLTQIADDARFLGETMRYMTCHSVPVGGNDVVAVWVYSSDPGGTGEVYIRPGYWDGSSWTFDDTWAGSATHFSLMIASASNAANFKRAARVGNKLVAFIYNLDSLSNSANYTGTNRHCDVLSYDPDLNTTEGWCVSANPLATDIASFSSSNGAATVGSVGGVVAVAGSITHFDPKGAPPIAAINRTVGLDPIAFSTGTGVIDVGGFLAVESTIYEPNGTRLFVGIEGTGTGTVSQFGGGTVGTGLRLATFDGATWAAWPEQPNSGVSSVYEAPNLTI